MQELRTKRHVVYLLHLHLVFTERMHQRLHFHFDRVCNDFECKLVETNGEKDHVHILVEPLPHTTPSRLVNSLKGVSSRFLRQEFGYAELAGSVPELEQYYWKGGLWSPSYFIASCGGAPLNIVKQYIENQ